jgi:hypothetical protein
MVRLTGPGSCFASRVSDRLELPGAGLHPALGVARTRQAGIDRLVAHRGAITKKRATEHNDARDDGQQDESEPNPRGDKERSDSDKRENDDKRVSHGVCLAATGIRQTASENPVAPRQPPQGGPTQHYCVIAKLPPQALTTPCVSACTASRG